MAFMIVCCTEIKFPEQSNEMMNPKHIFGQDDDGWGQPDTLKVFNEHIILCFGVNPLELLMPTETNGLGHVCCICANY